MKELRIVFRYVLPSILTLGLVLPAVAQQRGKRVFTNEDFPSAPPPPAAPAPAAAPSPAAAQPAEAPPAAAAPAPAASDDAQSDEPTPPPGLKERAEHVGQAVSTLRSLLDEFNRKEAEETDPEAKARWNQIAACMVAVLQGQQQLFNDLQEQLKLEESAAAPPAQ